MMSYNEATNMNNDDASVNYLNHDRSVKSWLLSLDHKRIAILYLISVVIFFIIGGVGATLVRLELMTPAGDLLSSESYNRIFTMHGVMMIFFFLVPATPAVLGNFLIPIMIGAKDVAFPRLNLASWYIFMTGAAFGATALILGGVDTGWTFYTPYSSTYANSQVILTAMGAFIAGFASILTGLNFIVTIHKMRAPGLTWFKLPLFIWAMYATSVVIILGTPVVAITLLLLILERGLGIGIFDPALGGDPVLFQHMFWFYSHPAVYIMILPGFGIISELISCFSRKRIFGYSFVAYSSMAIAILGFFVWGHHMFVSSQSVYAGLVFSFISFFIAVPTAVKIFNWTATLYKGAIVFRTPMVYTLGFLGLFLVGGLTGLFLSSMGLDPHLHDTYFVVAHFHYVMVGGMVMAFLGGLHFWWPKMFGRMYPQGWAIFTAIVIFIGFNLTFFPQFILGYLGMPRRYHEYPEAFQILNIMSSAGASVMGFGYLMMFIYLPLSLVIGKKSNGNPWPATGLEWEQCTSPPHPHNFAEMPVVTEEAYNYAEKDDAFYRQDIVDRVIEGVDHV